MRKIVLTAIIIPVTVAVAFGGYFGYTRFIIKPQKPASPSTVAASTKTTPMLDPTKHNAYDSDLAKKFVLYHELAGQLDDYAKEHAVRPEVRAYATRQSEYDAQQVTTYVAMLTSWGEKFSRMADFPKTPGAGCGTYPTFPGMPPHADVNALLASSGEEVDRQYLAIMTKHHKEITTTIDADKDFAGFGDLVKLRDAFLTARDNDMSQLSKLRQAYGSV